MDKRSCLYHKDSQYNTMPMNIHNIMLLWGTGLCKESDSLLLINSLAQAALLQTFFRLKSQKNSREKVEKERVLPPELWEAHHRTRAFYLKQARFNKARCSGTDAQMPYLRSKIYSLGFDRVESPLVGIYIKVHILSVQPFRNVLDIQLTLQADNSWYSV